MTSKIGIDVGGTFTDLFLWSGEGAVETYKALSTPEDPSIGVMDGLRTVAAAHGLNDSLRGDHTALLRRHDRLRRNDRQRGDAHDACRAPTSAVHGFGCSVKMP